MLAVTASTLESVRSDESFDLFWEKVIQKEKLSKSMSHSCLDVENALGGMMSVCQVVISLRPQKHISGNAAMKHSI